MVIQPTRERARHDPIRSEVTLDENGARGVAFRAVDTIGLLLARGTISHDEHRACERFRGAFHTARLDPLVAPDVGRIPTKGKRIDTIAERVVKARQEVGRIMDEIGGSGTPTGQAIWWVVGAEYTVARWCQRVRFGQGSSLSERSGRRLLRDAIGALAEAYEAIDGGKW